MIFMTRDFIYTMCALSFWSWNVFFIPQLSWSRMLQMFQTFMVSFDKGRWCFSCTTYAIFKLIKFWHELLKLNCAVWLFLSWSKLQMTDRDLSIVEKSSERRRESSVVFGKTICLHHLWTFYNEFFVEFFFRGDSKLSEISAKFCKNKAGKSSKVVCITFAQYCLFKKWTSC